LLWPVKKLTALSRIGGVGPKESTVRLWVYEDGATDQDDSLNTAVPLRVAYTGPIREAQDLEYDSVKTAFTGTDENDIIHSNFCAASPGA